MRNAPSKAQRVAGKGLLIFGIMSVDLSLRAHIDLLDQAATGIRAQRGGRMVVRIENFKILLITYITVLLLLVLNLSFFRRCLVCHLLGMTLDRTPMNMFKEDNMTVFGEQWGRQTDRQEHIEIEISI